MRPRSARIADAIQRASFLFLAVVAGGLLILAAAASLRWRVIHDTPILIYLGWLIEAHHRVPYRDFFDMNLPGTYAFFALTARFLGAADLGYRVLDLTLLAIIVVTSGLAMRPLGARVALVGGALFGLQYLGLGPAHSLQREYLMLVPLALALLALSPGTRLPSLVRAAASGALLGIAATFKPAFLIGLLPVLVYLAALGRETEERRGNPGRRVLVAIVAALAPPALAAAWLAAHGALGPFLDMARHYWPLYAQIGPLHESVTGRERMGELLWGVWAMGGKRWWLLPAALGVMRLAGPPGLDGDRRRFVRLLAALAVSYALYPAAAGQFWPYHWLPLAYLLSALGATAFASVPEGGSPLLRAVAPIALVGVFLLTGVPSPRLYDALRSAPPAPMNGRVEKIAVYLRTHLGPGDTVQPLDWTGGAVNAMLVARADLATSFVYDFHFYHHVATPYIQGLRERFVRELESRPPRIILWIETDKPWVSGAGTTRRFPALETFLADHYRIDQIGDGYVILGRTSGAEPDR